MKLLWKILAESKNKDLTAHVFIKEVEMYLKAKQNT